MRDRFFLLSCMCLLSEDIVCMMVRVCDDGIINKINDDDEGFNDER